MSVAASAVLFCFLAAFVLPAAASQTPPASSAPQPAACRSSAIELYNLGTKRSGAHYEQTVGLRNISPAACTIAGAPQFRIIGLQRQPAVVLYDKPDTDSPSGPSSPHALLLAPGAFASFRIDSADCRTGAPCAAFLAEQVSLPGDDAWLRVFAPGVLTERADFAVSSIRAGQEGAPPGWQPPTVLAKVAGGSLLGFAVTLGLPEHPSAGFPAHFTIRNRSARPQEVDWGQCVLNEQLSNSAGNTTVASQPCPPAAGPVGPNGNLAAGALATMDFTVAGDELPSLLCRTGVWHAVLQLDTSTGSLSFETFAFTVQGSRCAAPPAAGQDSQ